jgi:putative transposase
MARLPRLSLPGYAHHVIQRGNNRQAIFAQPADYAYFLELLEASAKRFRVALHAYVLMPNHFHLLATPDAADALSQMMQSIGRAYVRYFNRIQQRTGTLWEGRYRSTVIESERYLLTCMASLDLNPVRSGLVSQASDYPWSSHGHYIGLRTDKLLTPHALYWALGNTPFAREAAYADLVHTGLKSEQQAALTEATLQGWAFGEPEFVANLQKQTPRRVQKRVAGRPVSKPAVHEKR